MMQEEKLKKLNMMMMTKRTLKIGGEDLKLNISDVHDT